MPWRLIQIIVIFAVLLIFIFFNYENKCDISFGFFGIKEAPVFLTVFTSFLLGMLCSLPFFYMRKKKSGGEKPETGNGSGTGKGKSYGSTTGEKNKFYDNDDEDGGTTGAFGGGKTSNGGFYGID
jgi:hypothetical protein